MHRSVFVRQVALFVLALFVVLPRAANGQEQALVPGAETSSPTLDAQSAPPPAAAATQQLSAAAPSPAQWVPPSGGNAVDLALRPTEIHVDSKKNRPAVLLVLYASFASLQALDAHSTTRALDRGAVEANPLMRGVVRHPIGLLAVKAAGTAGVVYATERLWKRNKVAAVLFMAAANSAMVMVVQHNYRAVR